MSVGTTPSKCGWTAPIRKEIANQLECAANRIDELEKQDEKRWHTLLSEMEHLKKENVQLKRGAESSIPSNEEERSVPLRVTETTTSTQTSTSTSTTSVAAPPSSSESYVLLPPPPPPPPHSYSLSSLVTTSVRSSLPPRTVSVCFAHNGTVSKRVQASVIKHLIQSALELKDIRVNIADGKESGTQVRCLLMQPPSGRIESQETHIRARMDELPSAPHSLCLLCVGSSYEEMDIPNFLLKEIDTQFVLFDSDRATVPEHTLITFLSMLA